MATELETALLEGFLGILYGYCDHPDKEVAIGADDWLEAANRVERAYPPLAEMMRRVQRKEYQRDAGAGETLLVSDMDRIADEFKLYEDFEP